MLKEYLRLNLQIFADGGGDGGGGEGGAAIASEGGQESGEGFVSRLPERGKKLYEKVKAEEEAKLNSKPKPTDNNETPPSKPTHIPFEDLIKSDEYKDEHKAYMERTISDRLKRFKGIEDVNSKMSDALSMVADKYNLDPTQDDYLDRLTQAIKDDNSYIESYAMDNDLSVEEAKKSLEMKKKISQYEAEKKQREEEEARNYQLQRLFASAEKTKALFPEFDLETEMQNEDFKLICAATQGDTTKAYKTIHADEIIDRKFNEFVSQANQQIANTVKSNRQRPVESGLSSQAASITSVDFDRMNLEDIHKYWDNYKSRRA